MIRFVNRHLIIPQGDTGSFTLPTIEPESDAIAVFSIYDELTRSTVLSKVVYANEEEIQFDLTYEDTCNLTPGDYYWDVKIYHSPEYDDEWKLIGANSVDSYYSAYGLPTCSIKKTCTKSSEASIEPMSYHKEGE